MATITVTVTMAAPLELRDLSIAPVLAAATLKGRLRAECTLIVAALGLRACGGHKRAAMCYADPCPICQLFGGPWRAGLLYFEDLKANKPAALERRQTSQRGRQRGVVRGTSDAQYDLLPAGSTLTGVIRYDVAPLWPVGLAVLGLRAITFIGGGRSVGHGLCSVDAAPFDRNGQPIASTALAAYVATQSGAGATVADPERPPP
jgi:hypothetical protein